MRTKPTAKSSELNSSRSWRARGQRCLQPRLFRLNSANSLPLLQVWPYYGPGVRCHSRFSTLLQSDYLSTLGLSPNNSKRTPFIFLEPVPLLDNSKSTTKLYIKRGPGSPRTSCTISKLAEPQGDNLHLAHSEL